MSDEINAGLTSRVQSYRLTGGGGLQSLAWHEQSLGFVDR